MLRKQLTLWRFLCSVTVGTGFVWTVAGFANGAEKPYYEGKTITVLISSSPGGGTDTTGRLVAQFLPKFLAGNPNTIVQNMPGGGGTIANNYFTANAKPDGLTIFQDSSSGLGNFTRGGERIKYDPRKYKAIGSINRGGSILMVRKDARARMTDPKGKKLVVGDTDGIRTWVSMSVWAAEYLGWNLRYLYGYPGSRELALALRQGEIDMWGTQSARLIRDLQKDGVVDLLVQQADERRPDFPDVPTFEEALGSKKPSGPSWDSYEQWSGPEEIDKFLLVPAATPDDIAAMLRQAYVKMGKDEAFAKQATSFYGEAWSVRPGEWTHAKIKVVTSISKEARDFLQQIRKKYGLPVGK